MSHKHNVIKGTIVTDKSTKMTEALSTYTFLVDIKATKQNIKDELQQAGIDVISVRTSTLPAKRKIFRGKPGIRGKKKKATVVMNRETVERLNLYSV